jgi:hypothetical protein
MIMRGGGATGADGRGGAAGICVTLLGRLLALLGAWPETLLGAVGVAVVAAGGVARGGTATGGVALVGAAGVVVAGRGVFGGITTTDGGRYVAATEAGVTSLGVDGDCAGATVSAGFGGNAFGAADDDGGAD